MASKLGAGKDVLSYCNKCKLGLAHVIITMKDEKTIHKVKCKTCGATHAFKDPSMANKRKSKSRTRKKSVQVPVADLWMEEMSHAANKSQKYSIKAKFDVGDIIDHTKFGPGIVQKIVDNDKIEVMFRHDIKVLIHNKI